MASIIDLAKAKSLIQEYRDQNSAAGGPALVTPDKQSHHGFFIDRKSLEDVLSNPKVEGVSVNLAKHPDFAGKPDNVFTLVFSGAEPAPAGATTPYVNTGKIYSDTPPCPPICTILG
jgi:hypothetical protein